MYAFHESLAPRFSGEKVDSHMMFHYLVDMFSYELIKSYYYILNGFFVKSYLDPPHCGVRSFSRPSGLLQDCLSGHIYCVTSRPVVGSGLFLLDGIPASHGGFEIPRRNKKTNRKL